MISVVNGFDVASRQSVRDKWDISKFMGKIKVLDGFKITEPKKKNFNDSKFQDTKVRDLRNKQDKQDFADRRKIQLEVFQKYIDVSNERGRWVRLVELSGTKVKASHLSRSAKGETTIANMVEWEKIKTAIEKFVTEKEIENQNS